MIDKIRDMLSDDNEQNTKPTNKDLDDRVDDKLENKDVKALYVKHRRHHPHKQQNQLMYRINSIDELKDIIKQNKRKLEIEIGEETTTTKIPKQGPRREQIWYDRTDENVKQTIDNAFHERRCEKLHQKLETKKQRIQDIEQKIDEIGCQQ